MSLALKEEMQFDAWTEKKELIKRTYMKGASDDELELFGHVCKKTGLDPMMKQIFAIARFDSKLNRDVFTFQTSIDGFRVIADRTGRYAPGPESKFEYNKDGELQSATAYVKKLTSDGTWHTVSVTAFWDEYVQKTKEGKVTKFWIEKGHLMLSKCAESLALRKAFPAELSQATKEEEVKPVIDLINDDQISELESLLKDRQHIREKLYGWATIHALSELPASRFESAKKAVNHHIAQEGAA
jgi:phage recombination protein Bet